MTTIKEIVLQSIGEPAQVKIERGQKGGYGYELKLNGETLNESITEILKAKERIEKELYGMDTPSI